jgi:hydrogenase 3 maturation protease
VKQLSKSTTTNFEQIRKLLCNYNEKEVCFLCIGNPLLGDDGIGCYIAELLSSKIKEITLINAENTPENYVSKILNLKPKALIAIDAVEFSSHSGDIKIIMEEEILNYSYSTHTLSMNMIIDYMRMEADFDFYLIGIQPGTIKLGSYFSSEVLESANKLIDLIRSLYTKKS